MRNCKGVRSLLVFAVCGTLSCNMFLTRSTFDKKVLKYQCTYFMECYDDYFDFDNVSDCMETFADYGYYSGSYYDDCDFKKKAASRCLSGMKIMVRADCDDYDDAYDRAEDKLEECDEVYDCDSDAGDGPARPAGDHR